jgi:hypothetical protein
MLHMEDVRRVMRSEVMCYVGQQARCFIAGRLYDLAVQTRQRLFHERLPRVLIAGVGRLLQNDQNLRSLSHPLQCRQRAL